MHNSGTLDRFFYQLAHQHLNEDKQQPKAKAKKTKKVKADKSKPKEDAVAEDTEVIDLSAMPLAHAEDFDHDVEEAKKKVVTLDDMIVAKNK